MDENQYTSHPLTRERKVGFLFLLLFAILTVSLGALQLRNTIYGPFVVRAPESDIDANVVLADETTRLQQIDTDRDGLSDYDELYFFETSPYLEDTDSDGILDKVEVDSGGDPLCPVGTECSGEDVTNTTEPTIVGTDIGVNVDTPSDIFFGTQTEGIPEQAPEFDLEALAQDPVLLRQTILATGQISEQDLEQITDEQLLSTVQNLLNNQATQQDATQ